MIQLMRKLIVRFCTRSPLLFRILNVICNVCLAIGFIQEFLTMFFGELPAPYNFFANKVFMISAGVVRILSGLTVDKKHKIGLYENTNGVPED